MLTVPCSTAGQCPPRSLQPSSLPVSPSRQGWELRMRMSSEWFENNHGRSEKRPYIGFANIKWMLHHHLWIKHKKCAEYIYFEYTYTFTDIWSSECWAVVRYLQALSLWHQPHDTQGPTHRMRCLVLDVRWTHREFKINIKDKLSEDFSF